MHPLNESTNHSVGHAEHHGIQVVHWNFRYVSYPLIVSFFLLAIALFKIVWHHIQKLSLVIPESCMLILLGCIFGALFRLDPTHEFTEMLKFSSKTFFLFLLPPIILESSYSLTDRAFSENLGTILLYAVVGTILNIIIVGASVYGLSCAGAISRTVNISIIDCFVFSALICAVDPVAVLAIFEEVGVNKMLFYMVFGESLLNDAVTVVLYNLMVSFKDVEEIGAKEIGLGLASFLCVAGGACVIGCICGFLTAFITKYTSKIRVVEPITMYTMAYLSYLLAEMIHFSGIISIICCGIIQAIYAANNISPKSLITVNFFAKVMSSCTESIIFIILGVMMVSDKHQWKTGFILWSLLVVLASRFIVVYFLTWIVNFVEDGLRKISGQEQFIISYGGLRGAVSFSLAFMLSADKFEEKDLILTCTMVIIMFTVFVQGITIKPLVRLLRIRIQSKKRSVFAELNRGLTNHLGTAFEDIIGHTGSHVMHEGLKKVSQNIIRPAIQKHPTLPGTGLLSIYTEVALKSQLQVQHGMTRNTSTLNAVINSLQVMENSGAPSCLAETIVNVEDRSGASSPASIVHPSSPTFKQSTWKSKSKMSFRERRTNVPAPLDLDNAKDLLTFRDLINTPLNHSVAFSNFDRNLNSSRSNENLKKYAHLLMQRRNYPNTKDAIASLFGTTLVPPLDRSLSVEHKERKPLAETSRNRLSDPLSQFVSLDETDKNGTIMEEDDLVPSDETRPLFTLENLANSPRGRLMPNLSNKEPLDNPASGSHENRTKMEDTNHSCVVPKPRDLIEKVRMSNVPNTNENDKQNNNIADTTI